MARVKRGVTARARHKKTLAKRKVITVHVVVSTELQNKQLPKRPNMLIGIAVRKNVHLERFGSFVSMPLHVSMVYLTAYL